MDPVLLLPGRAGLVNGWAELGSELPYRTITVEYPPGAATLAELVDRVLMVLDGVERVHVVGQSLGGMVAEALIQRVPDRIVSVVFTSSGLYGPEDRIPDVPLLRDVARSSGEFRPGWHGPALLLHAADDTVITEVHRERLLALHSGCEVRIFPDGGHTLLVTRPAEYVAAITEFLG